MPLTARQRALLALPTLKKGRPVGIIVTDDADHRALVAALGEIQRNADLRFTCTVNGRIVTVEVTA